MRSSRARLSVLADAALALSLAGCGASIGVEIGGEGQPQIDAAEAPLVAASSLDTIVTLAGPGIGIADDPSRIPPGERPRRSLVVGTFDWIERTAARRGGALRTAGGRFTSDERLACDAGTMRVRADFAGSAAFAAGDVIDLDSTDCRFGGTRFSGGLTVRVADADGFPGVSLDWIARLALDFRGWRVETTAAPVQSRRFDGSATLEVARSPRLEPDLSFAAGAVSIEPVIDGAARPARSVESVTLNLLDSVDDTLRVGLRLVDRQLAGTQLSALLVDSVGTIVLAGGSRAAPSGRFRIEPGSDSAVIVELVDASQIRLDIDRFADGRIEVSLTRSLQDLRARL